MDEAFKKQAFEWFERGRRDLETARLLYDKRGYADYIAYHIQLTIQGLTPKLCFPAFVKIEGDALERIGEQAGLYRIGFKNNIKQVNVKFFLAFNYFLCYTSIEDKGGELNEGYKRNCNV